jgi:hypothetical protein
MAGRVRRGTTNKQGFAAAVRQAAKRSFEAVARRSIVVGALLTMVLLSMSGAEPLSSRAVTAPSTNVGPTTSMVTLPTVTLPTVTLPTVTRPTVTLPTATIAKPTVTPPPFTVQTSTTPTVTVPKITASSSTVARQRQLRSLVVRLSGCLSILQLQAQRLLLLRAGIETSGLDSGIAVAHDLHISPVRETELERASLRELRTAARNSRCRSTPAALIEVPARDRLVSVDPELMNLGQSAADAEAFRAAVSGVGKRSARLSLTLGAGNTAAKIKQVIVALPSGLVFSRSKRDLVKGIVAKAGEKRLRLTAKVSHGRLTIKFKTPAPKVQFTIANPAITVSKKLAQRIRTTKAATLRIRVGTTSTSHKTTRIALNPEAR